MTTPSFDWAKPQQPNQPNQANLPSFDWAKQPDQPQPLSDVVGNLAKNWFKVTNVQDHLELHDAAVKMRKAQPIDPDFGDSELNHIRDAIRLAQRNGSGLPKAMKDFAHFYNFVFNPIKDTFKKVASGAMSPGDVITGIPRALTQQISDFAETGADVKLTDENVRALTPEEKAARIKSLVGMGVMMATGSAASKLLAAKAGLPLASMSDEELMAASRLTAKGQLAKTLMKSAVVSSASGAAYGMTAHANEPDQLAEIITNGIVFAPLGVAHELIRAPRLIQRATDRAKAAGELAQLRATQVGPSDSFESAAAKVQAVSEANNLDEAALLSKVGKQSIAIIPGVDPSHVSSLTEKAKGYRASTFVRGDGTSDILLHDGLLSKDQEAFFKRNGVYRGQSVSFNGDRYLVTGEKGDKVKLSTLAQDDIHVDKGDIRYLHNEYPLADITPQRQSYAETAQFNEETMNEEDKHSIRSLFSNGKTALEQSMERVDLVDKALSNNMRVRFINGKLQLRDIESDRVIGTFDNHEDAATFIDRSGQSDGVDLAQDAKGIDQSSASGGRGLPPTTPIPPSGRAYPWRPFERRGGVDAAELIIRSMDNVAFLTRNQDFFLKLDSDHGTAFHGNIVDPSQQSISVRNAAMKPWIKQLEPIMKSVRSLSQIDRFRIGEYLKAKDADGVRQAYHVTPMEDAIAMQASKADLPRVFQYLDQLDRIDEEFKSKPDDPSKARYVDEAEKRLGLKPEDKDVADKLRQARTLNAPSARVGVITRLAESIANNELSRGKYAVREKLNGSQLHAAHALDEFERRLNDRFGLPQGVSIHDYLDHAKFFDDNIERAMKDFPGSPDFFTKIGRAGFTLQSDPIHHALEYVRRGFDVNSGFQNTMDGMKRNVSEQLKQLPEAKRKHVGNVINNYLDDLKGYPDANDTFLQASVDTLMDKLGLKGVSVDVRRNFVNTFLAITHLGGVGFRAVYGLFHFHTGVSVSIAGRSLGYTARMLNAGAHALRNPELIDEIRQQGGLSTISPIMQLSPDQYQLESATSTRAIVQGARKASELGLKLTLMPTVFEGLSAGHYLTTKADALASLTEFGRGSKTWDSVRQELFLGRYDQAVETQFKKMVDAGKPEDAASYLGRRAVNDLVGQFGNANRPYKWGTTYGRLLGQFGVYPAWLRSEVSRLASRGTPAERIAAVAKLSAIYWATAAAGNAVGLDVHRLNPFHSYAIGTGPLWSIMADIHTATTGTGYSQQAAASRLQRMLPAHTDQDGNLKFAPSILVPGSFELDSFMQGLKDTSDDPVLGMWEMAGGRPSPDVQAARQRHGLQQ